MGGFICPRCKTRTYYSLEPNSIEHICVKCVLIFKVKNNSFRFSDTTIE